MAAFGAYRTLATQSEWLLLGKSDSSKVVNLVKSRGCFWPEADIPKKYIGLNTCPEKGVKPTTLVRHLESLSANYSAEAGFSGGTYAGGCGSSGLRSWPASAAVMCRSLGPVHSLLIDYNLIPQKYPSRSIRCQLASINGSPAIHYHVVHALRQYFRFLVGSTILDRI